MTKNFNKALPELVESGILSEEKANEIRLYYQQQSGGKSKQSWLIIVFGILGAILIGLGIILIIAHNWDELTRPAKTILAFLPLVIGQAACVFVILQKSNSTAWREGAASFLFFAVGASISLISQIYHIPGDLSSFLLTWMILTIPLVYLLRSSVTSLLFIGGITYFACQISYWSHGNQLAIEYWLLLVAIIPHYLLLWRKNPQGNFLTFHHWFLALSIVICLGTFANSGEEIMFVAYISLFALLYIIGNIPAFKRQPLVNNAFLVIGSVGTIILLLMLSFDWYWMDLQKMEKSIIHYAESLTTLIVTLIALSVLIWRIKSYSYRSVQFMDFVFVLFIIIFFIGHEYSILPVVLINFIILAEGLLVIKKGADRDHLGILNYGLSIITALVICRFFDTDISFIVRGLLFVMVGAGFFSANYLLIKRRNRTHG